MQVCTYTSYSETFYLTLRGLVYYELYSYLLISSTGYPLGLVLVVFFLVLFSFLLSFFLKMLDCPIVVMPIHDYRPGLLRPGLCQTAPKIHCPDLPNGSTDRQRGAEQTKNNMWMKCALWRCGFC